MKSFTVLATVSKIKLATAALGGFIVISVLYAVFAIHGGNSYEVSGHFDPETGQYVVTIESEQAAGETLFLMANHEALVSLEMFEMLELEEATLHPAEQEGVYGVAIEVAPTEETLSLALPVSLGEEDAIEFVLKRGNRTLQKIAPPSLEERQALRLEADMAAEEAAFLDIQQQETNESAAVELLSERAMQGERAEVSDYQELRAAFSDSSISEIVFLADITVDYTNEANNRLTALNRSVSIDGNGFTLTTPKRFNTNGTPNYSTNPTGRFFELTTTHDRQPAVFELKNMTIDFQGNNLGLNALIYQQSLAASAFWTVKIENIEAKSGVLEGSTGNDFLYLQQGNLEIRGTFHWVAHKNPTAGTNNDNGSFNVKSVLITDEADVKISNTRPIFRLHPNNNNISTSFRVNKGSKVDLYSVQRQVIWANLEGRTNEVIFEVDGEGTVLNVSSQMNLAGANGAIISLIGQRDEGNNKFSRTIISGGAVVNSYSRAPSPTNGVPQGTTAFVNQISKAGSTTKLGGNVTVTGEGSQFNLFGDGQHHDYGSVMRFRLVGEQTFVLADQGKMNIVKYHGNAAAVRMYGRNNEFYVESAGQLNIFNHAGTRTAADDGIYIDETGFAVFDQYNDEEREFDPSADSTITASNGSDTAGRQGIQFPLDGSGTSVFHAQGENSRIHIYAHRGPAVWMQGGEAEFLAGKDATFRMEGRTLGANNGIISSVARSNFVIDEPLFYDFRNNRPNGGQAFSNSNRNSTFMSNRVGLAVWEKRNDVNLDGDPDNFWNPLSYQLGNVNFAQIVSPQPGEPFSNEFNSTTFRGGNAYTRFSANNYPPMIQHLVTPTNADKTFYAKAVVPYEYTGAIRDAWDDEVWVEVALKDEAGNQLETQWLSSKSTVDVFGEVHNGVIAWTRDDFFKTGQRFEVLRAHRGLDPTMEDVDDSIFIHATEESIAALPDAVVVDVRPPTGLQVAEDQVFNERTTTVSGIMDFHSPQDDQPKERVAIYASTAQGLIRDASGDPFVITLDAEQGNSVPWQYQLPRRLDPEEDVYIEFYAKDFANDRYDDFVGTLPDTTTTEPNGQLGSTSPSASDYEDYLGYRDAIGDDRFPPALSFEVTSIRPSDPSITLRVPQSFDRDEEGNPIITVGNQMILRTIVESNDARNSGKDDIENAVVTLDISPNLLTFLNVDALVYQDNVASATLSGDRITIHLERPIAPGDRIEWNLTARVDEQAAAGNVLTPVTINGRVSGNQPETENILIGEDSLTLQTGTRAVTGELINLAVHNNQLQIFYSNLSTFDVYMDGTFYRTYNVQQRPVTDSVTLDIPVHDIRNLISVRYKDENGADRVSYWNNIWDFID